jgi:hypothetical protein
MKKLFHSILLLTAFGLFTWQLTACKRTPSPPTEQDAIAVWKNTHARPHLNDLIDLKKTNGQIEEVNGVNVYTLFYEVKEKSVVQLGNAPPGTITTYQGNYPFKWTEKGWMGPDNQVYPEH